MAGNPRALEWLIMLLGASTQMLDSIEDEAFVAAMRRDGLPETAIRHLRIADRELRGVADFLLTQCPVHQLDFMLESLAGMDGTLSAIANLGMGNSLAAASMGLERFRALNEEGYGGALEAVRSAVELEAAQDFLDAVENVEAAVSRALKKVEEVGKWNVSLSEEAGRAVVVYTLASFTVLRAVRHYPEKVSQYVPPLCGLCYKHATLCLEHTMHDLGFELGPYTAVTAGDLTDAESEGVDRPQPPVWLRQMRKS